MTTTIGTILPSDRRGRVRVPAEQREALLAEFDKSGMNATRFAKWAGIKYPTFGHWLQERRRQQAETIANVEPATVPTPALQWVEAKIETSAPASKPESGALLIHLPGGARIEVSTPAQAVLAGEILKGMENRC